MQALDQSDPYDRYRPFVGHFWPEVQRYEEAARIPPHAKAAWIARVKKSHRGIARFSALEGLRGEAVDQDFLEEICELEKLEYLDLGWPTTAKDFGPLARLQRLRFLKIDSPRNITDFSPLLQLPRLESLFIENAKHLSTLDWLEPLASQLKVLGVEGSMHTDQKIESLAPLRGFNLDALYLVSARIADQDLTPLHGMTNLCYLRTALNAPRAQFEALHAALPDLQCNWFDPASWKGFRDPPKPRAKKG